MTVFILIDVSVIQKDIFNFVSFCRLSCLAVFISVYLSRCQYSFQAVWLYFCLLPCLPITSLLWTAWSRLECGSEFTYTQKAHLCLNQTLRNHVDLEEMSFHKLRSFVYNTVLQRKSHHLTFLFKYKDSSHEIYTLISFNSNITYITCKEWNIFSYIIIFCISR